MSLEEFANFGYEVDDEDYYDLSAFEEVELNELEDGNRITGKPVATTFISEEEYKSDSMRFFILATDDNGLPIKVKFYCSIPKPIAWTPDGYPLVNLFRNNKYDRNTYNAIFSILKLQGMKNIYDKDGNPRNSFKNVSAKAYLDILAEQEEITIEVKNNGDDEYNTFEIINIK